jgi:hypothetical protein
MRTLRKLMMTGVAIYMMLAASYVGAENLNVYSPCLTAGAVDTVCTSVNGNEKAVRVGRPTTKADLARWAKAAEERKQAEDKRINELIDAKVAAAVEKAMKKLEGKTAEENNRKAAEEKAATDRLHQAEVTEATQAYVARLEGEMADKDLASIAMKALLYLWASLGILALILGFWFNVLAPHLRRQAAMRADEARRWRALSFQRDEDIQARKTAEEAVTVVNTATADTFAHEYGSAPEPEPEPEPESNPQPQPKQDPQATLFMGAAGTAAEGDDAATGGTDEDRNNMAMTTPMKLYVTPELLEDLALLRKNYNKVMAARTWDETSLIEQEEMSKVAERLCEAVPKELAKKRLIDYRSSECTRKEFIHWVLLFCTSEDILPPNGNGGNHK